jgi:hypothetical protein
MSQLGIVIALIALTDSPVYSVVMHHQFAVVCFYYGVRGGRLPAPLIRNGVYCTQEAVRAPKEIGRIFDLDATGSQSPDCSPADFARRAGFKNNTWRRNIKKSQVGS